MSESLVVRRGNRSLLRQCFSGLVKLLVAICLIDILAVDAMGQAQGLPGEEELPGRPRQATEIPDESMLPGDARPERALPGENLLPGQVPPEESIGDNPPMLRLAFDGHTGLIRTLDLSDGGRTLVSAGDDKDIHVWRRSDVGDTGWIHRRTIRWPVERGPRGRLYAARLKGDHAAFAGHGAFGSNGEIRIADVASGDLEETLVNQPPNGHEQIILSLAWSPAPKLQLASLDMEGRVLGWEANPITGIWEGKTIVEKDAVVYPKIANALKPWRIFGAVTFSGSNYLVVPKYVGANGNPPGVPKWHLQRFDLREDASDMLVDLAHVNYVTHLTSTPDGRVLASSDGEGSIGLWKFGNNGATQWSRQFKVAGPPLSIDLDDQGEWLLVGTQLTGEAAKLQLWDIAANPPRKLDEKQMDAHCLAVVIDRANGEALVSQGSQVHVIPINQKGVFQKAKSKTLEVPARPVRSIAFSKEQGGYKLALGWSTGETRAYEGVFDLSESKLLRRMPINPDDYVVEQRGAARWQYRDIQTKQGIRTRLFEGGQARGVLPLVPERNGWTLSIGTLPVRPAGNEEPDEKPAAGAVIVGTSGANNIYAYRADAQNPPELLRQFRGHSGEVTSLSVSADGLYLASASDDATVSIWNLQDIYTASKTVNLWGAEFEIQDGNLVATNVREDGPLYFKGVREGDQLVLIEWRDNQAEKSQEVVPEKMQKNLREMPFDHLVVFKFERRGRQGPSFQSYPAWRPIATLFVDDQREWAFWTPAGYYDASFNGHQRFGWQINNRFVDRPVEYFRAAQFRKVLERPDVMRRLLQAGSLQGAMRRTVSQIGPPPSDGAIVNQIESRPRIQVLPFGNDGVVVGDRLTVTAKIEVPIGATLVDPRAFVSGVPATERTLVSNQAGATGEVVTYEWKFRLPSDPDLLLEVLAATEAEAMDRVVISLKREQVPKPKVKPRLHVLAIGVGEYRDPQIQSLDFAADAAGQILKLFRDRSSKLYDTSGHQLVDRDATRPLWRVFAQTAAEDLSETVSPDDLVIMYLCGHGLRDRRTNEWYFVTADARYRDLMNDQYDDCIAFSDLAALSRLPCRKLAILDSCHSGAVQPQMERDDLKSALRFLQDDVVLTLTASEGDEEAAEVRQQGLGRFTAALVRILEGKDRQQAGNMQPVTLQEAIDYVMVKVPEEAARAGLPPQHPTASPSYLLRTLTLPLTNP